MIDATMSANAGTAGDSTTGRILDVAERLAQVRGFNGFSYADIAAEVGITKAALHYHFATKADLGEALIGRYAARFGEALAAIDGGTGQAARLRRSLRRRAPEPADVPVRDAGGRISDAARCDASLRGQLLRPERGLAARRPGAGTWRRQPAIQRIPPRRRSHDHQLPGRRDARRPALRRHPAIPGGRGQPHDGPHLALSHPALSTGVPSPDSTRATPAARYSARPATAVSWSLVTSSPSRGRCTSAPPQRGTVFSGSRTSHWFCCGQRCGSLV